MKFTLRPKMFFFNQIAGTVGRMEGPSKNGIRVKFKAKAVKTAKAEATSFIDIL